MRNCNCCCKNGSEKLDFLIPFPGGTPTDASYEIGLTHFTCGGTKMLLNDPTHPVISQLDVILVGTPVDLGDGNFCQECEIAGTVTYKPCGCCNPRTEYVSYGLCLPCSSAVSPNISLGNVVASPKAINYYQNNGCGCCQGTYQNTNQITITTSINVATGA